MDVKEIPPVVAHGWDERSYDQPLLDYSVVDAVAGFV